MRAVVGLGNPGAASARTRHNMGFQCVDRLAREWKLPWLRRRLVSLAQAQWEGEPVVLVKPRTFMNHTGQAARYLVQRFRLSPGDLLAVYDDMDLPVGTVRLRPDGGSAGHRGIASTIQALGTQDFPRLRIGIGHPPKGLDPVDYVLAAFPAQEREAVQEVLGRAVEAILCLLKEGMDSAMNQFN